MRPQLLTSSKENKSHWVSVVVKTFNHYKNHYILSYGPVTWNHGLMARYHGPVAVEYGLPAPESIVQTMVP